MNYWDEFDDEFDEDEGVSNEDLIRGLRGDYGPERQAEVLALAELEIDGEGEAPDQAEGEEMWWAREFVAQQQRLEKKLGHKLSGAEINKLVEDQSLSDQQPDLLGAYDRVVGRNPRNTDDRLDAMAEFMEEDEQRQDAEQAIEDHGAEAELPLPAHQGADE